MPAMQGTWVRPLVPEDPLEKGMVTHSSILFFFFTPVFLAGEFHGQRSLEAPWGHKELDVTEQLTLWDKHQVRQLMGHMVRVCSVL